MSLVLLILLIVILLGALPNVGPIDHSLGYGPSSILGVVIVVLLVLILLGRI
jgi:hypothetical protein